MEPPPPIKPPRGVKPAKETSGLLMSVIRALSTSETNEQRDREKAKLENEYKISDQKLDDLVLAHEADLTKVMHLFGTISQLVTENRDKIKRVKENLQDCKEKLHCRRDELQSLWQQGLEYKYMLQLLDEIERINEVPNQLTGFISRKQYLQATKLLVGAVNLGKGTLDGVESLKELRQELEQKKEQLHFQLLSELKQTLYTKPAENVLALRRQGSGRDGGGNFNINSPLQRSGELRLSGRRQMTRTQIIEALQSDTKQILDQFDTDDRFDDNLTEENSPRTLAVLVKSLCLLDKLPYIVNELKQEMQSCLFQIVHKSTLYVKDYFVENAKGALKELVLILFDQFKDVAAMHEIFLKYVRKSMEQKSCADLQPYNIEFYWTQVQAVLQIFLTEYLDIQNTAQDMQITNISNTNDLSAYFSRRKPQMKKKTYFKFDNSSSALSLSDTLKTTKKDKILICQPHPNNILVLFIPFMCFIEDVETAMNIQEFGSCSLNKFLTQHVSEDYLKQKSDEIVDQIEVAVRSTDAWRATVLLDATSDYKPILVSTVTVERCIREWRAILQSLPLYSERIAEFSAKGLKEYKDTCYAAYRGIVQPHSEDRRICSAAWLKDDDISRFLKSLPNWLNLKTQQEVQARSNASNSATKRFRRVLTVEEESPEDVRKRNRREAEILAANLGEDGISAGEILSDMTLLKELAQLQESMEWFAVKMFQFAREFRAEPMTLSPSSAVKGASGGMAPVSATVLQQLTSIAQEFDELANTCLLLLHLEVRVQCFHYLLAQSHYNKETHEPDPKVLELSRVLANVDEAMTSSLHARKCKYIFEGLGHLIAKILISSAQYMQIIDEAGIQRMCRNIFALQQTLTNITMTREVALDHARHYFELFFLTPEEILNGIVDKGPEFSELEYMNALQLLHRSQRGKGQQTSVTVHLERLTDILGGVGVTV